MKMSDFREKVEGRSIHLGESLKKKKKRQHFQKNLRKKSQKLREKSQDFEKRLREKCQNFGGKSKKNYQILRKSFKNKSEVTGYGKIVKL